MLLPFPHEQFEHVQLEPHEHPEPPWLPVEYNKHVLSYRRVTRFMEEMCTGVCVCVCTVSQNEHLRQAVQCSQASVLAGLCAWWAVLPTRNVITP